MSVAFHGAYAAAVCKHHIYNTLASARSLHASPHLTCSPGDQGWMEPTLRISLHHNGSLPYASPSPTFPPPSLITEHAESGRFVYYVILNFENFI